MIMHIGFSKPKSNIALFAKLIQWVEKRPYDHVYIKTQEPMDLEYVIFQASKEMVNLYNKDIFFNDNVCIKEYQIEIDDKQYALLWNFIMNNLGVPYSLKSDFGILLTKIFRIKQPFNSGYSSEFCSKLAAQICNLLGIVKIDNPDAVDPSSLDKILSDAKVTCV
jgi:hypothetical protein